MKTPIVFRSGMSSISDFHGAIDANVPVGVVACKITSAQILLAIPNYVYRGGYVFVDSGAFSERTKGEVMDWRRIVREYMVLADMCWKNHEKLFVVAPDKVGDQLASIERLTEWKTQMRHLIDMGVSVIVPVQTGELPPQEVVDKISAILGTNRFIVGIPSNQDALSIAECESIRHHTFHILGRVQIDETQTLRTKALLATNPDASISYDACWLQSRLKKIGIQSQLEREGAMEYCDYAPRHPRAAAITKLIESDQWGVPV